jgi:HD-GYP domain-containing protein (c-di-GMP phosphodiesterase class II)
MPNQAVATLKQVWEALPAYEQQHSLRTANYARLLGIQFGLTSQELPTLWRGALLHDIGKGLIEASILTKPGPLTPQETECIRRHPTLGRQLLAPISSFDNALDLPLCHHERWDGCGYPQGLKGEAIPLLARLLSIVDVWDALISDRPYSAAWSPEKTHDYILACSGSQFDPTVVEIFIYSPIARGKVKLPATQAFCRQPVGVA